jgi:ribosomal protein S18 acetylase RimI-like enzyme
VEEICLPVGWTVFDSSWCLNPGLFSPESPRRIVNLVQGQMTADPKIAQIRIATPDDAPALGAMHVASWRETYAGLLPDKMLAALSVEARAGMWAKIMQEPATERSTAIYLAEYQGTIIGFGSCGAQRTEGLKDKGYNGEFSAIYVLREFQKRKIGARLLRAMSSDLQRRGFNSTALWVLRGNLRARHFYEHFGGKVIAEREDVRDGAVLIELAYGWPDLKEMDRLLARE